MIPRFWQTKDSAITRRLFSRAVERNPNSAHSLHAWAMFERDEGNTEEARGLLKRGLEIDPKNIHSLTTLGNLEADQEQ